MSDDNPFSEAHFKTLKYHPGFPDRFGSMESAIGYLRSFIPWYNTEHRHGGLSMMTPEDVHLGRATRVLDQRRNGRPPANWRSYPSVHWRSSPALRTEP